MSLWEQIGQITCSATDIFKEVTSGVKGLHSHIFVVNSHSCPPL